MWRLMESAFSMKIFWLTAIGFAIYLYVKKICYSYWAKHGVPHPEPIFPFGNFTAELIMEKIPFGHFWKKSYLEFKNNPFYGAYLFHSPVLIINSPDLIKQILIKDFAKFIDRGLYYDKKIDPLSDNLFFINGERWKVLRAKLSPTFTSNKLKGMFPILAGIGDDMIDVCDKSLMASDIVDVKNLISRYTIDVIFSVVFGFSSNTLYNQGHEFYRNGNLAIENSSLRSVVIFFVPTLGKLLRIQTSNATASNFFKKLFSEMVERRRMEKVKRQDFLSDLIELMDNEQIIDSENLMDKEIADKSVKKLDLLEAAAQAYVFFVAGFETSSSVVSHTLYELAMNPDVQLELQKEIDDVLSSDGGLTYDSLFEMNYLDMVVCESLRMHPSVPILNRICLETYQIPNSNYYIPKGMHVVIPVSGLHYNPDLYPEPNKFDPTRFNKHNIETRKQCTFLSFGEGPRFCIGKRMGLLQVKVAIFKLLSSYTFSICEKTIVPLQYTTKSVLQSPKSGVYLKLQKRNCK